MMGSSVNVTKIGKKNQILFFNAYGSDPYSAFLIQHFFYFFPLKFLPVFLLIAFVLPTFSLSPRVARIIEKPSLLLLLYLVLPPQIYQKSASGFHPGPRIAQHSLVFQIKCTVVSSIPCVFPSGCHVQMHFKPIQNTLKIVLILFLFRISQRTQKITMHRNFWLNNFLHLSETSKLSVKEDPNLLDLDNHHLFYNQF